MRKIRLNIDRLDVESFEAGMAEHAGGTVQAQDYSNLGTCGIGRVATCQFKGTCVQTCWSGCVGGGSTSLCAV